MPESRAVAIARAHIEAWSKRDFDSAQEMLADDVHVIVSSTNPGLPQTDTTGADAYMEGLKRFAGTLVPGSHSELAAIGDDRYALITLTLKTDGQPFGEMTLPGSRLYLVGDDGKIQAEHDIFFLTATPD